MQKSSIGQLNTNTRRWVTGHIRPVKYVIVWQIHVCMSCKAPVQMQTIFLEQALFSLQFCWVVFWQWSMCSISKRSVSLWEQIFSPFFKRDLTMDIYDAGSCARSLDDGWTITILSHSWSSASSQNVSAAGWVLKGPSDQIRSTWKLYGCVYTLYKKNRHGYRFKFSNFSL